VGPNQNGTMDSIKGAQKLAELLEARHGVTPEAVPRPPLADTAAVPIFHWVGIEPPLEPLEESRVMSPTRRLLRLTRYLPWRLWA
jgi:hypothetical protein